MQGEQDQELCGSSDKRGPGLEAVELVLTEEISPDTESEAVGTVPYPAAETVRQGISGPLAKKPEGTVTRKGPAPPSWSGGYQKAPSHRPYGLKHGKDKAKFVTRCEEAYYSESKVRQKPKRGAMESNCTQSQVPRILKKEKEGCGTADKPRSGRPWKTSSRSGHNIKKKSVSDIHKSAAQIPHEINEEYGVKVSLQTVVRRLRTVGLNAQSPVKKPFISAKNRKVQLEFAKEHGQWQETDWCKVLWSDESKFNLFCSDGSTIYTAQLEYVMM
ncbi:uncharacterized protein [Phyllobates terribilis]|uniref:uncharacterized protein n=1 Tax=Phyllobates terribilis TaxID=111132 RepID=UPI003CCAD99D